MGETTATSAADAAIIAAAGPASTLNAGDVAWMLASCSLVLLMTIPGAKYAVDVEWSKVRRQPEQRLLSGPAGAFRSERPAEHWCCITEFWD